MYASLLHEIITAIIINSSSLLNYVSWKKNKPSCIVIKHLPGPGNVVELLTVVLRELNSR
jgi:hypothetical protein